MDCQGLGGPRGGLPKPAMSPRMIVALSGPEGTEAGDVDGAGPGRRTGSRQNSGAYQAEDAEEHQNAARKPRRAAAAAAAFLTASVFEDEDDEDEPAYRGSKRRGRGVAAMAHNYQMTYGNDGWAALLQGGEEGADAKAQAAAEGAARPAKRPRGRPLASSAGAGAAGTSGEASAIAPAPAGHGTGGSKFFPMESQLEVRRFLQLLLDPDTKPDGELHISAYTKARKLESMLRQLLPQEIALEWSGPLAKLQAGAYRNVEDLFGHLQDAVEKAVQLHTQQLQVQQQQPPHIPHPSSLPGHPAHPGASTHGGNSALAAALHPWSNAGPQAVAAALGATLHGHAQATQVAAVHALLQQQQQQQYQQQQHAGAGGEGGMAPANGSGFAGPGYAGAPGMGAQAQGQQAQAQSEAAGRKLRQLSGMKDTFVSELQEAVDKLVRRRMDTLKKVAAHLAASDPLASLIADLPPELCGIPETVPRPTLPASVLHNREPYFSAQTWRKEPFPVRPYERISSYAIRSSIPSECQVLAAKLRTKRPDGAAEHFSIEHGAELGPTECKDVEAKLAAAVRARQCLVLGQHVIEVDCWGMDCYTRKNIFDAVRESGAYSHVQPSAAAAGAGAAAGAQGSGTGSGAGQGSGGGAGPSSNGGQAHQHAHPTDPATAQGQGIKPEPHANGGKEEPEARLGGGPVGPVKAESGMEATPEPSGTRDSRADRDWSPSGDAEEDGDGDEEEEGEEAERQPSYYTGRRRGRHRRMAGADGGGGAAAAAANPPANLPPAPPPPGPAEAAAINDWIDREVLCTAIAIGGDGWNLLRVMDKVVFDAKARGDATCVSAATAVVARLKQLGWNYFRLHPKGRGVICAVPGGLPAFTFVEEYLGELHSPWRWFEIQDAIKKLTQQELPDFYNITLERPRDDPDGFDVMFVEAAFMASFASRMSHSCTPNCAAVVVSVGGRLTIAMYAKRKIEYGEELTFDYSSVTESEKEYREAICLCGTRQCRGSYLYYSGSTAFTQIMEKRHNFLHRQALLVRASVEQLSDADWARLKAHSLGPTSLGDDTPGNNRCPDWLIKWAALVLQYVELERRELPSVLLRLPPVLGRYTEQSAKIEADAIAQNRVQQIVITLDKVKHFLRQPGQLQTPPMRMLTDEEVATHLWNGATSVARRAVRAAATVMCNFGLLQSLHSQWQTPGGARTPAAATPDDSDTEGEAGGGGGGGGPAGRRGGGGDEEGAALCERLLRWAGQPHVEREAPLLCRLVQLVAQQARNVEEARSLLLSLESLLREVDCGGEDTKQRGHHTAAADVLHMYAATRVWFTAERSYKGFASPPVELHDEMVKLHRIRTGEGGRGGRGGGGGAAGGGRGGGRGRGGRGRGRGRWGGRGAGAATAAAAALPAAAPVDSDAAEGPSGSEAAALPPAAAADGEAGTSAEPATEVVLGAADTPRAAAGSASAASAAAELPVPVAAIIKPAKVSKLVDPSLLSKRYGPWFMWGQLSGWYKQTVYDPTASLSAERRGTLSLPDIDSCYPSGAAGGSKPRYTPQHRTSILRHIETCPDAMWKTSLPFNFKNDQKIYGSPMMDQVYLQATGKSDQDPLPAVIAHLKAARTPHEAAGGKKGKGGAKGR